MWHMTSNRTHRQKNAFELGGHGYPLILVGNNKFYGSDPKTIDYYIGR